MTDVTILLKQFTSRYQMALIAKAAVFGALTLGIAEASWWRLHLLRASPWWSIGVPTALILASVAGLAWWLRLRWISVHAAADKLDNTLGLQQRLVTTLEFAGTQPSPALYPQLVDDTTHVFASQKVRVPLPIGRATLGAAVVLLLLLLWPFQGTEPIRLAGLPGIPPSTPPPQPETPPPSPDEQDQRQNQQQDQRQDQGQDQQPQSSSGGQSQEQQQQQQQSSQPSSGGQQSPQPDAGTREQQQQQQQQQQQASGGKSQQEQRAGSQDKSGQGQQQAAQQAGQREGSQQGGSQSNEGVQQQQTAPGKSGSGSQRLGGGQDALKADIQQLLKELSGELKDLQQQLSEAETQAREAGTGTDAKLYGDPEALEQAKGPSMPIQLKTDAVETDAARPGGGGVGQPSGEISGDAPQVEPEAAQLAEESLEDAAVSRQRVPPEYQSVFDRLYRRTDP